MTGWKIYWLTRLDGIKEIIEGFTAIGIIFGVVGSILCIVWYCANVSEGVEDKDEAKVRRRVTRLVILLVIIGVVAGTLQAFIPSTKAMAAILVIPKIANNENVKELPENLLDLCNEWAETKIKDLKEEQK